MCTSRPCCIAVPEWASGVDGDVPPAHEVVNKFRNVGLTALLCGTVLIMECDFPSHFERKKETLNLSPN